MKYTMINEEVLYAATAQTALCDDDLKTLARMAQGTARKRIRLCTHQDAQSALQEMFIVHTIDAYVRPHKHLDKDESLHILTGEAELVFFDESGRIDGRLTLGPRESGQPFYCRVPRNRFHMLIILTDVLIFRETTSGPFDREKMTFAPWAPADDVPGAWDFVDKVRRSLTPEAP